MQTSEFLGYEVRLSNSAISPTGQHASLNRTLTRSPEHALQICAVAGIPSMRVSQVAECAPIGVVDDVADVLFSFLLTGTAHDTHRRPNLNVAAMFTRQALRLCNTLDAGFWRVNPIEVHIRVTDGELAPGW